MAIDSIGKFRFTSVGMIGGLVTSSDWPDVQMSLPQPGVIDPYYRLLLGRFFDRVKDQYPVPEQLPTATIPEMLVPQVVQQRFRIQKDGWPLLQIGPGILTVNDTAHYTWTDFRQRGIDAMANLHDNSYPNIKDLQIESLVLQLISTRWNTISKKRIHLTSFATR